MEHKNEKMPKEINKTSFNTLFVGQNKVDVRELQNEVLLVNKLIICKLQCTKKRTGNVKF